MRTQAMITRGISWFISGVLVVAAASIAVLTLAIGVVTLGRSLSYLSGQIFPELSLGMLHYILITLGVGCMVGLSVPILLLARNIRKTAENFSLLQFEDDPEDGDYDDDEEGFEFDDDREELNEFLKTLQKARNIGPFIPSPKSMNDLCPCGSGLKYKDCCGKAWV